MKKIFTILLLFGSLTMASADTKTENSKVSGFLKTMASTLKDIKKLNHKQLKVQARLLVEIQKQNHFLEKISKKDR